MGRAKVFLNASSGWDDKTESAARVRARLTDAEVEVVERGSDIAALAREAVADGLRLVVAGGGDGTLNAVASGLVGTRTVLGVLPVGTLNHFARDLKIPLDVDGALGVIATGITRLVDVGEVNGRVFLNNSIIGLYPIYRFIKDDYLRQGWHRWVAFVRAVATVLWRYPFFTVQLEVDGRALVRRTPYILVANNEHAMQGYELGSRSSLDKGELWVYVMRRRGRWGLLKMVVRLVAGQFSAARDFEVFAAREVRIETKRRRIGVALDGEIAVMEAPLEYRVRPRALRVMAPGE
jgi:diacylglycerol kinase family enzyme